MKAIGTDQSFNLEDGNLFYEFAIDTPEPEQYELLVRVETISVNPVDTKIRKTEVEQAPRILGFDAVGVVEAVGDGVSHFSVGDEVFYSGSPKYQVLERILSNCR